MCTDCDVIAVVMDIVLSIMGYTFLSTAQNQVKKVYITGKILSIIGRALYWYIKPELYEFLVSYSYL